MKFTSTFSALLVVLPLIANVSALSLPEEGLVARQRGGFGGFGGNKGQAAGQGAAAQAAASKAAAAAAASKAAAAKGATGKGAAATTTAAAAAATTTAAAAGTGNNAASGTGAAATGGDPQSSTTINPAVIQTTDDGQNPPVAGQSAADTSLNNFANDCLPNLAKFPLTNGLQITTGSCNPIPIGQIPSTAAIPSCKFQSPTNGDTIAANTAFTVTLANKNIQLGTFTNAQKTYFANPQKLNAQGQIIGHTHIVIESIDSLATTKVSDPTKFQFFKGVDTAADAQGNVQVAVAAGLPAGFYRMGTIMSSATHQPVIVAIAQHGIVDDMIYITVSANGAAANNAGGAAAAGNATAATGAAAGTAATGNGAAAAGTAATGKGAAAAGTAATGKGAAAAGTAKGAAATTVAAAAANTGKAATGATAAKGSTAQGATSKGAKTGGRGGRGGRSRL
jgi:hypothetical protein